MRITSLKCCLSKFKFFLVSFFPLSFVHFDRKYNQVEENLNHRLNKVEHKFAIMEVAFDFLINIYNKGPESKQKQTWGADNAHPNVHSKSTKQRKKTNTLK